MNFEKIKFKKHMENFWEFLKEPLTKGDVLSGILGYTIAQIASGLFGAFVKAFKNASKK